ncbi:Asparagine synthase family protein [Haladaptatus paucihalophilus DX253]|uniref:Putative asparagine synthetase [glutamine-hydrolyzing] n=1 Tax=Haladaptatus paucihalophilus DX253 TaxID=797209 RepID=E7QV79_HALPU|nr:asparagine synthase-related protein [Haladaptatus paucihalophilus]EFW91597.1 Asparagine synthase family protein [Haladaptatus paucihalophilus DX253]SHL23457.1 asparagine synthase (glutamine-hydrolysing) [Haladaptatus paucihalophilus DX253]
MPGVIGGTVSSRALGEMFDAMDDEEWYETAERSVGDCRIGLVHHGDRDPNGWTTWQDGARVGMLHGVVSNRAELGCSTADIFERVLADPDRTLPKLSGPFLLVAADRTTTIVASDKLGTRPCYYSSVDGFLFGSQLSSLVTRLHDPRVDERAVSDMLFMGYVFGRKTLVSDVRSLRPASYLRYEDGNVESHRYWEPDFGIAPQEGYVDEAVRRYRRVVGNVADTIDGRTGVWLSGGLDSRTLAAALKREIGSVRTFTYDNSATQEDRTGAERVAESLSLPNKFCEYSAGEFVDTIERGVDIMDGMLQWSFFVNLPPVLNDVSGQVDVLFEGSSQGEFFGDVLYRSYLTGKSSVDALVAQKGQLPPADVRTLLSSDISPTQSLGRVVEESTQPRREHRTLDALWELFADSHFRSNRLYRSQAGTRVPFADGEFMNHVARMPYQRYRIGSIPGTRGRIPSAVAPLKLEVARRVGGPSATVPYNRTNRPPTSPLALHAACFVADNVKKRLTGPDTCLMGRWYRTNATMRSFVDGLLDDACSREVFDSNAIRNLQHEHLDGHTDHLKPISAITTLELWLQKHLDAARPSAGQRVQVREAK